MSSEEAGRKKFKFIVDDKVYEWDQSSINGAQIRAIAKIDPAFQLFLEGHGDKPDELVLPDKNLDLSGGEKKFFTVPPATFGLDDECA